MTQAAPNTQLTLGLPQKTLRVESRMEAREEAVRRVEYTSFPRVGTDTLTRVGFTRNVSPSGMALGVDEALPVGSLVRVIVQSVDGKPDFGAVARVAWGRESHDGAPGAPASWLGLVLVAEVRRGLARVPRSSATPLRRTA